MTPEQQQTIIKEIKSEAERIQHGKVFVEITVAHGELTNQQIETRKSVRLKY